MKLPAPALAMLIAIASVATTTAADVTLEGKVVCARCTLKKADARECQNVLVVTEQGRDVEYYMARNAVAEAFGEVCTSTIKATVTGEVAEKDGRKWITPSRIDPPTH